MRPTQLIVLLCAAALTACTVNPYTGEQEAGKAVKYGAGAAAVCALIGAIDSKKKARNAALGCGIVGAGVGGYMDVQEAKLRNQLQGTGVQVAREGDNIRLIMPGNITFESDSHNLRSNFYPVLDSVAVVLAKYADTTMRVTGHTDSTGSRQHNNALSEKRANSVASYLKSREVVGTRMYSQGMGFSEPIASNDTADGRAQNRRVELYILPAAT